VDCRHKRDYFWFKDNYADRIKRVRITADQSVRVERGWKFTEGVDDGPSECDLDDITDWDLVVLNNGDDSKTSNTNNGISTSLDIVTEWINTSL
jgi:phosphomevalonate kinase